MSDITDHFDFIQHNLSSHTKRSSPRYCSHQLLSPEGEHTSHIRTSARVEGAPTPGPSEPPLRCGRSSGMSLRNSRRGLAAAEAAEVS